MSVSGPEIAAAARKWLGVKWRHQGRSERGVDCIGIGACVAADLGFKIADRTNYGREPIPAEIVAAFRANGFKEVIPRTARQIGDVLVFRDGRHIRHVGIQSEKHDVPHLIHATAGLRQVVEEPLTPDWMGKLVYVFRFPGVD
ncbi:MAG TPA: NlpC/P60 family protein [Dongiaceae bacterium]|nr:NlpC/P60 family protein [Dongiaceae bacterium]